MSSSAHFSVTHLFSTRFAPRSRGVAGVGIIEGRAKRRCCFLAVAIEARWHNRRRRGRRGTPPRDLIFASKPSGRDQRSGPRRLESLERVGATVLAVRFSRPLPRVPRRRREGRGATWRTCATTWTRGSRTGRSWSILPHLGARPPRRRLLFRDRVRRRRGLGDADALTTPSLQGEARHVAQRRKSGRTPAPTLRSRLRRTVHGGGRGFRAGPRDHPDASHAPPAMRAAPPCGDPSAPPRPSAWRRAGSPASGCEPTSPSTPTSPTFSPAVPPPAIVPVDDREPLSHAKLRELIWRTDDDLKSWGV